MSTKKQNINDVYDFCINIGLKCKSTEYTNSKVKMEFECSQCEEVFSKSFVELKIYNKNICHKCNRKNRDLQDKIETFQKVLDRCNELGLKCLSTEYVKNSYNMEFECTECNKPFKRCWSVLKENDGTICRSCISKEVVKQWKYTYEEVYSIFENGGCKLLSKNYVDNKTPLEYICDCGETSKIVLSNFLMGQRCQKCARAKRADFKRTSIDEVKKIFEDEGCILISEVFNNSNENLDYICACGNKSAIRLGAFKNGARCRRCAGNESPKIEHVQEVFEENNCTLISTEYINSKLKLDFLCSCGNKSQVSWEKYLVSPYKKCKKCADKINGERITGDKHPNYNPEISDEERIDRRLCNKNKAWRYEVYKRDNYICKCCGNGGDINAHHLDGYNWCKEKRYDVNNGIALCVDCHRAFHKKYGYGGNTSKQFEEFIKLNKEKEIVTNL